MPTLRAYIGIENIEVRYTIIIIIIYLYIYRKPENSKQRDPDGTASLGTVRQRFLTSTGGPGPSACVVRKQDLTFI